MASRFYRGDSSSSEESSSDDGSDVEQDVVEKPTQGTFTMGGSDSDSSSSDDDRRVIKTQKEKRTDQLNAVIKKFLKSIHNREWYLKVKHKLNMLDHFLELQKELTRSIKIFKKEGGIPPQYFQIIRHLQTVLKKTNKEELNSGAGKVYNTLRMKLTKVEKEHKKGFEKYDKNPLKPLEDKKRREESSSSESDEESESADDEKAASDESDEDSDDESSDSDNQRKKSAPNKVVKKAAPKKASDSDSDDSDSDSGSGSASGGQGTGSGSDDSGSDDSEDAGPKKKNVVNDDSSDDDDDFDVSATKGPMFKREYWMKKIRKDLDLMSLNEITSKNEAHMIARELKLSTSGGKNETTEAISNFLMQREDLDLGLAYEDLNSNQRWGPHITNYLANASNKEAMCKKLGLDIMEMNNLEEFCTHATESQGALAKVLDTLPFSALLHRNSMRKKNFKILLVAAVLNNYVDKEVSAKMKAAERERRERRGKVDEKKEEKKEEEFTPEMVRKKLKDIIALRGKRGTDRDQVLADLELLATKAADDLKTMPVTVLKIKTCLVSALFDASLNRASDMPLAQWKRVVTEVYKIMKLLDDNPKIKLTEDNVVEEEFLRDDESTDLSSVLDRGIEKKEGEEEKEKKEEKVIPVKKEEKVVDPDAIQYVFGNVFSYVQRLSDELTRSLQTIDPHSGEYVDRLKDETSLLQLCERVVQYYDGLGSEKRQNQSNLQLVTLSALYYRFDTSLDRNAPGVTAETYKKSKPYALATSLYQSEQPRVRAEALLYHIYSLALHNHYQEAHDLFLMSHVQDTINEAPVKIRILFNRAVAQLGLCAYRAGAIRQALTALDEFYKSGRVKELLAQGVTKSMNRWGVQRYVDEEKEKEERRRQYPYHMYINTDMLEATHLTSAMLVEVASLAVHGVSGKGRISKPFRTLYHYHERQASLPPENTRERIMAATRKLLVGDWQTAWKYLSGLRMWGVIRGKAQVQEMLKDKLKHEALRCYLLKFGPKYVTISMENMQAMFDLSPATIHKITSKMIITDELHGAWDQPTGTIRLDIEETTPLQKTALKYADKVNILLDHNVRLMEQCRTGMTGRTAVDRRRTGGYKQYNRR